MPAKSSLKENDKQLILKLYQEGYGAPYIANKLGIATHKISYFVKKSGISRTPSEAARKYSFDENFFKEIDTEEKAYWLGFMYADGYASSRKYGKCVGLTLSSKDKKHLMKFVECLHSNIPIHDYISSTTYGNAKYSKVVLCSDTMYRNAVKQGIVEHKTNILTPPIISKKFIPHFIRGYFDGDGCLTSFMKKHHPNRPGKHCEYAVKILGTKPLLDFIKDFIEDNKIAKINQYYRRKEEQIVLSLELSGNNQVKNFLDLIYEKATVYLDRKYERYQNLCNLINSRVTPKGVA